MDHECRESQSATDWAVCFPPLLLLKPYSPAIEHDNRLQMLKNVMFVELVENAKFVDNSFS